jgi:uncharacterized protein YukJ
MPVSNYGLLIGRLTDHGAQGGDNPHYLLVVQAGAIPYRVSLNVQSTAPHGDFPARLQYCVVKKLAASKLAKSITNQNEFVFKNVDPDQRSLDYIRDGIVNMNAFTDLEPGIPLKRNAFYKELSAACAEAQRDTEAFVAVFGTGYPDQDDRPAGPGQNPLRASIGFSGVDNVHMNQGSFYRIGNHADPHFKENGTHQDGAVLFFFGDNTVTGFFTKFDYQDNQTNDFGNPMKSGIADLDSLKAIPGRVRNKLLQHRPPTKKLLKEVTTRAATAHDLATTAAKKAGKKPKPAISGTSGGQAAPGWTFGDTTTIVDPNRPFDPDNDAQYRNSRFVKNFAVLGTPEAVPSSRNGVYPVMKLEHVIDAQAIASIKASGGIVFHAVGDTGAVVESQYVHEESVAELMVKDFAPSNPTAKNPAFFFHLGDVVYYYGEGEFYYDQFYHPYKEYPGPIFAIPGNHDGITHPNGASSLLGFISAFCDDAPRYWAEAGGILRSTMTQPGGLLYA